jgi:sodium/hydrogen antiporter
VALGLSLIWTGLSVISARTLGFAVIALFTRTLALLPLLKGVGLGARDQRLIALFGPRGLSSLLYVLLAVFAGVSGAEHLFAITSLVVLLSVVVHGGGMAIFLRAQRPARSRASVDRAEPTAAGPLPTLEAEASLPAAEIPERIDLAELDRLEARDEPVVLVDARADRSYRADAVQAKGAVRLPPDDPVRAARALRLTHHGTVVVYCA